MVDPRVEFVGLIDNNNLTQTLANDLVVNAVGRLMAERAIDTGALPFVHTLLRHLIGHVQIGTPLGRLFLRLEGFSQQTFPAGPAEAIAFVQVLKARVRRAITSGKRSLPSEITDRDRPVFIHELEAQGSVNEWLEPLLVPVKRLFKS